MTIRIRTFALAGAALFAGSAAIAHHGWGDYDAAKPFSITGAVESVSPANPHVTVSLKQGDKLWLAVLAPPSRMTTRGMDPETIKAGARVVVEGYPKKTGEAEMRAERITMAGKTVELR